jgi:hypothetical protein
MLELSPSQIGQVRVHAGGDVVVDRPQDLDLDPVPAHDRGADLDQPLGVGHLGRTLQGAVEEQGPQAGEVPYLLDVSHGLHASDKRLPPKPVQPRFS